VPPALFLLNPAFSRLTPGVGGMSMRPRPPFLRVVFQKEIVMLLVIALVLVVLWALGFFAFHVAGGLIHLLLVIGVIVLIVHLFQGRRV
jgi:hypothetical protein